MIVVGSSLLLSAALLGNGLGLRLGLRLLRSFLVGRWLRLRLDLLSTALLLRLLNGGLIMSFGLWFDFLGPALLGILIFDGGFFVNLRLWLSLLGSSLSLGSFDERSVIVVVGLLFGSALLGLLSGRSLSRLLLFFLVNSFLAATLLGRLLGWGVTTILRILALDCMHC